MKNLLVYAVIGLGVVGYNIATQADRDGSGAIVGEGHVDAFRMQVGDCFDDTGSIGTEEGGEVSSLPGVPCGQPHDNEVYAVFDVTIDSFPSDEEMSALAFESCKSHFVPFVGTDYESSSLDILTLYPTRESWSQQGDREVVCALFDMEANKLTGSARDSAI